MTKQDKFNKSILENNIKLVTSLLKEDKYPLHKIPFISLIYKIIDINIVDPSQNFNNAILTAARFGHFEIVKLLLQDKRVEPSQHRICGLSLAAENGHFDVVKILLDDKRIDPTKRNNYAIIYADKNSHSDIVQLLWQDKRVKNTLNHPIYNQLIKQDIKNKISEF